MYKALAATVATAAALPLIVVLLIAARSGALGRCRR